MKTFKTLAAAAILAAFAAPSFAAGPTGPSLDGLAVEETAE
jgi:Tfp pilus assembly protein FimT